MRNVIYNKPSMYILLFLYTAVLYLSLLTLPVHASAEEPLNISSDYLEYISKDDTYIGRGNVRIQYEDLLLMADEVILNNSTADAVAYGNVIYDSREMVVHAEKLELNLNSQLGKIHESYILYKKKNYHIRGGDIEKTGKESYQLDKATVTSCDADPPEWHISASDISVVQHDSLTARAAKFYIKNIPVIYTPYFTVPLLSKRQTGILNPAMGYTSTKGFAYKQGFYWAIRENQDATLYLDYYSKKGLGKGIDYRYILSPDSMGEVWVYHLKDKDLERNFSEVKSYLNHKFPYGISSYLKVNAVNDFDYYDILESTPSDRFGFPSRQPELFGFLPDERQQKYLESNIHFSKSFSSGRIYLLSQYRQSLEESSGDIPQNLPEIGMIMNTKTKGPVSFNVSLTGTHFWREEGQTGQRIDLNPNLYMSFGREFTLTQKVGLHETAYFLDSPSSNENRTLFDLETTLSTRLLKQFSTFNHIIEPSVEYKYVPDVDQKDLPEFDSSDSIPHQSEVTYSLTNRLAGLNNSGPYSRFRLSQSYSLLNIDRRFSPVVLEGSFVNKRIKFNVNTAYDVYEKNITDAIASVRLDWKKGFIGIGKNFRRSTNLDQYSAELALYSPIEIYGASLPVEILGNIWYDLKGGGVQELNIKTSYRQQCWGFSVSYTKDPNEYQIMFGIEFTGLGVLQLG